MKKILTVIFILTLIGLFLIGCVEKIPEAGVEEPTIEPAKTTESEIDAGMEEIEGLEKDLDTSDLEDLEKDLAEIDW